MQYPALGARHRGPGSSGIPMSNVRPARRVLVTGATGFIGRFVEEGLRRSGWDVTLGVRSRDGLRKGNEPYFPFDLDEPDCSLPTRLTGFDSIVHLAARVHQRKRTATDDALYRRLNVESTRQLAQAAAVAGVRRLVYMSTIKVNGEATIDMPFTPRDTPSPVGAYAVSKLQAEIALMEIVGRSGLEVCTIRPPLVYGPGVGGNFLRMLRWVGQGWPVPLGSVQNLRSYVSVWNLASLVGIVLSHPGAANRVWLVADGPPMSTPQLIRRLAAVFGRTPTVPKVPVSLLRMGGKLMRHEGDIARLCDSLVVDDSETRAALGWNPPVGDDDGLYRTVVWYRGLKARVFD